ncbi:MAG: enolase [Candidatus Wildermuthbacteria bacterium]|nr:enolase [Candidatus Wildermuthbacteria bacterium]
MDIKAGEILDSRGMPTVTVELKTDSGVFRASVPSGVSTGSYEAVELRDKDGRGVKKAIENIEKVIAPVLEKEDLSEQKKIDEILIDLDGTKNKSRLGANAILAVSMAVCRALAASQNLPLYSHIAKLAQVGPVLRLPQPSFNMIEGGKHAPSAGSGQATLAFQEFMAVPQGGSFKDNLETGRRIYGRLKNILEKKFGEVKLSREGAFSPPIESAFEAIDLILESSRGEKIGIAIDAAGAKSENYDDLIGRYPIISIEDPFGEEEFEKFAELKSKAGDEVIIFGDDLTASNVKRIKLAEKKGACSGLILKPNQIGTVTETIEAAKLAKSYDWKIMVANRAGETEDDFIADLAVGIGADFIKSGAPFPKERMAKYNRLLEVEEELYNI